MRKVHISLCVTLESRQALHYAALSDKYTLVLKSQKSMAVMAKEDTMDRKSRPKHQETDHVTGNGGS